MLSYLTGELKHFLRISEVDKAAEDNSKAGRVKSWLKMKKLKDKYADEEGSG